MIDDAIRRAGLATRVSRAVKTYVRAKTENRANIKHDKIPTELDPKTRNPRKQYPAKWRKTQVEVAREAFLQMRSRRSKQDFIEYFASTLCAYGQPVGEAGYLELADALLAKDEQWEDVRALAMLAVSTLAYEWPSEDRTAE